MKKFILNYVYVFVILLVNVWLFELKCEDYVLIKYVFPSQPMHMFISILVNYFYLRIALYSIEYYIDTSPFLITRIGKQRYFLSLLKRVCWFVMIFIGLSVFLDLIFYQRLFLWGVFITLGIEIIIVVFMIVVRKWVKDNTFIVSLLMCIVLKWLVSLLLYSLI